jgi:putative heme transporter
VGGHRRGRRAQPGLAVWPFQAALPRLRYWPGFMEVQTSTAVSTTVPAGGALALGLTYRMFGSFGFTAVAITSAVATTGIWNLGFKFALPIVAVELAAATGQHTGRVVGVALLGVLAIALSGTVLWLVFAMRTAPAGSAAAATGSSTGCCGSSTGPSRAGWNAPW